MPSTVTKSVPGDHVVPGLIHGGVALGIRDGHIRVELDVPRACRARRGHRIPRVHDDRIDKGSALGTVGPALDRAVGAGRLGAVGSPRGPRHVLHNAGGVAVVLRTTPAFARAACPGRSTCRSRRSIRPARQVPRRRWRWRRKWRRHWRRSRMGASSADASSVTEPLGQPPAIHLADPAPRQLVDDVHLPRCGRRIQHCPDMGSQLGTASAVRNRRQPRRPRPPAGPAVRRARRRPRSRPPADATPTRSRPAAETRSARRC